MASKDIKDKEIVVKFNMKYADNYRTDNSQILTAVFPVSENGSISLEKIDTSSLMSVGNNNRIGISYRNNGLSTVNDLVLHINGANITEQELNLGNIGSGMDMSQDAYIEILEAGEQNVSLYFTYTGSTGNTEETDVSEFTINAAEKNGVLPRTNNSEYDFKRNQINTYLTYGILGVGVLLVLISLIHYIIVRRKSKKTL